MTLNYSSDNRFQRPQWWTLAMYMLLFIVSVGSFYVLDLQGLWMGDDLGYMFTDTSLHKGDGAILTSPSEIITTQASHWMNCNGRFIVHTLVQLFVGFLGKDIFCAVNALMFGMLVLLTCRLALPVGRFGFGSGLSVAVILWLCLPRPGVTMLSLVSYSVNYLWTAVIILFFLLFWRAVEEHRVKRNGIIWACIYAFFAASWQESFSVPVSAGLIAWWCVAGHKATGREISVIICFLIGTILISLAPGNFHHALQGGGIAPQALLAKVTALGKDLLISPLMFLALAIIVWTIGKPEKCRQYCERNVTLLTAVLAAAILATFSYTAIRQLFAPFLFAAILIIKMFVGHKFVSLLNSAIGVIVAVAAYSVITIGAYQIRRYPQEISRSLLHQATAGNSVLYIPENDNPPTPVFNWFFDRYNDDPVNGRDLHLVFDHYTKQGLSRLYSPGYDADHITTIIPVSQKTLEQAAAKGKVRNTAIYPAPLTKNYDCFRLYSPGNESNVRVRSPKGKRFSYERIYSDDYIYYVVPAGMQKLTTADTKAIREKKEAELRKKHEKERQEQDKRQEYRHAHHPSNPTSPRSLEGK